MSTAYRRNRGVEAGPLVLAMVGLSVAALGMGAIAPSVSERSEVPLNALLIVPGAHPWSGTNNRLIATVPLASYPSGNDAIFDATNGFVYLVTNGTNLTVVNGSTNRVVEDLQTGPYSNPNDPLYVAATNDIYVPQDSSDLGIPDNVSVVSGATGQILENISTGFGTSPTTPLYVASVNELFVPDEGTTSFLPPYVSNVTVILLASDLVVAQIPVGGDAGTPAFDPVDNDLYVPSIDSNNLSIIDVATNTVVGGYANLSLSGATAVAPTYSSISHEVYQPNFGSNNISVFRGSSFEGNISVGPGPGTPVVDPVTGDLYIAVTNNDSVVVINPATNDVVANVAVGTTPDTPVYDPSDGEIYVSNGPDGTESAINASTNTVVATISVGAGPIVAAFDSANDDLYVPNTSPDGTGAYNVSVIGGGPAPHVTSPGTYSVTFTETGLPSGTSWNVTFNGT